jgi:transposase-like protein
MKKISYCDYRFPREVIKQAIWLYLRCTPSFRDVEDLLAGLGIMVSYESARRWVNHFGPMIATDLRKLRPKPHTIWHLEPELYSFNEALEHRPNTRKSPCRNTSATFALFCRFCS